MVKIKSTKTSLSISAISNNLSEDIYMEANKEYEFPEEVAEKLMKLDGVIEV